MRADNAVLRQQVSTLKDANDVMARRIVELEKKSGRNSQNSSMPPSSDTFGRPAKPESPNRKARRAMGRKPGKQPGAPGAHLAQVENPDSVVPHRPEICTWSAATLAWRNWSAKRYARSLISLNQESSSPILASTSCVVRVARSTRVSSRPIHEHRLATARLRANGLYLMARQHLPMERAAEAMADLFGRSIPPGSGRSLRRGCCRAGPLHRLLRRQICASPYVHFDETPIRVREGQALHPCRLHRDAHLVARGYDPWAQCRRTARRAPQLQGHCDPRPARHVLQLHRRTSWSVRGSSHPKSHLGGGRVEPDRVGRGHDRFAYRDEVCRRGCPGSRQEAP